MAKAFEHIALVIVNIELSLGRYLDTEGVDIRDLMAGRVDLNDPRVNGLWAE